MYCSHCGTGVSAEANFCPACGTPVRRSGESGTTASIELEGEDTQAVDDLPDLAPGTAMLVVVRGPSMGARFLLDREVITIGRHPEADLFLDDVTVSRHHAEIHRAEGDAWVLRDLGSLNGSYVGDDRVDEHHLADEDELQIGRFKLLFMAPESA